MQTSVLPSPGLGEESSGLANPNHRAELLLLFYGCLGLGISLFTQALEGQEQDRKVTARILLPKAADRALSFPCFLSQTRGNYFVYLVLPSPVPHFCLGEQDHPPHPLSGCHLWQNRIHSPAASQIFLAAEVAPKGAGHQKSTGCQTLPQRKRKKIKTLAQESFQSKMGLSGVLSFKLESMFSKNPRMGWDFGSDREDVC